MPSRLLFAATTACGLALSAAHAQTLPAVAPPVAPYQQTPAPNVPPQPVAAQPALDATLQAKLQLLRQRVAERDQLQREIDQLSVETQTPQEMIVYLELLEVNRTIAEKLGIAAPNQGQSVLQMAPYTPAQLDALQRAGAATSLASPKLRVISGQDATAHVGGPRSDDQADGGAAPQTDVRARADSLGNNRVHVDFRIDHSTPTEPGSKSDPAQRTHQLTFESHLELAFGESQTLGGLTSIRTRTRRGALGRVTETIAVETVLRVRAEAVMPRSVAALPASTVPH
jgi:citrate lyase gamma subunit